MSEPTKDPQNPSPTSDEGKPSTPPGLGQRLIGWIKDALKPTPPEILEGRPADLLFDKSKQPPPVSPKGSINNGTPDPEDEEDSSTSPHR